MKKLGLLSFLSACWITSQAAFAPVALTGFNTDIVANGTVAAASSISSTLPLGFDGAGYTLVSQDYNFGGYTPTYYLPTGGAITSAATPGLQFQLADYSSNNALRLVNSGDNGTLTFATPRSGGAIYVCGLSGSGASTFDLTVNFSDGTTQTLSSVSFPDWYDAGGTLVGIGRVSSTDNHTEGSSTAPSLFEALVTLDPANYAKIINSITVSKTSTTGVLGIMAISAEDVCSGTPTAGAAAASVASGCSEFNSTLSLPTSTSSVGITYQWQSSADGIAWTSIPTATNATYNADVIATTYYRAYITCTTTGGGSDTSSSVELLLTAPAAVVATLPFSEGFESWTGSCFSFDRPGTNWLTNPASGNNSWRRDDEGADASWVYLPGGAYSPVSTVGAHSARFHSYEASTGAEGDMDLHVDLSPAGTKQISFDYINTSGSDNVTVQLSEDGGTTFSTLGTYTTTSGWATQILTTTSVAANAIIRFAAISDDGFTDIGLDNISIIALTPCSGAPSVAGVTATQYTGCSSFNSTVSLPLSTVGGITYQWQTSTDSAAWANIPGATDYTYSTFVTDSVYYRILVTCTASTITDTSAGVLLAIVTPVATIATVPYFQSFENWIGTCFTADRPSDNWLNSQSSGNDSWRRDDQGADAAWNLPTSYSYSPVSVDGAHSARFHSGEASSSSQGNLDLSIDLSTPGTKLINFDYINLSGSDHMNIKISEDGGSTFTTLATFGTTSGWTSEVVSTTSIAANAVIRINGVADFGVSDIGVDSFSVSVAPSCAGAPVAGTFTSSITSGCTEYTANLSVDTPILMTGISYQWQSSTDGVTYTNVSGATSATYPADVTANVYYRFYVTCAGSGLGDTSSATELFYAPVVPVFATVPYFQGFENWIGGCYSFDRPDASWANNPSTGNNSWRRDDQGDDASWDATFGGSYFPTSTEGAHSARFHTYEADFGSVGNLDLYIDLSAPGTKRITFDYNNDNFDLGSDELDVYLSEDSGATFTNIGSYGEISGWVAESITTTSIAPHAIIRFAATSDFGDSDIGIDSLNIAIEPTCAGAPTAGTFTSSSTSGCTAYTSNLTVDTPIYMVGISYQWQSSTDGVTYTNVSGATDMNYTASVIANTYYRFYVVCAGSGLGDTSSATELFYAPVVPVYATVPYFQGFENWIAGCYSFDRPGVNWANDPSTGNNSWRRDDQGDDASWDATFGGSYFPTSTEGAHSARFHSYEADFGSVGNLDLYIDLSAPGTKQIAFDYNNDNSDFGSDELDVMLSEDGGTTFTTLATYDEVSGWVSETISTTSIAPNAIIRFAATSDFGDSDIGIDSLSISVPSTVVPCDSPTALTVSGITGTGATVSWTGVTGAAGYQYVVNTTAGDPTGSGTATTATTAAVGSLAPGTVYYAHVRTECGGGDSSVWVTVSFTTLADTTSTVCGPVTGLTPSTITDSSAVITWNSVAGAAGYDFIVDNTIASPTTTGTAIADTSFTATGLACASVYYVHVRTDCSTDSSAWTTITIITDSCSNVGVNNVSANNFGIQAYPNPAKEIVTVEVTGTIVGTAAVQLTDVTGKVIEVITLTGSKAQIDMSGVTPGIYFLNYADNTNRRTIKINKQ